MRFLFTNFSPSFIIILLCAINPLYSFPISGTVVDSANGAKPLSGVLVSVGHTMYRTVTDTMGRYSLEIPSSLKTIPGIGIRNSGARIFYNVKQKALDISHAPEIKEISIFDLRGSLLFHSELSDEIRTICLPRRANGLAILRITLLDKSIYNFNLSTLHTQMVFEIPRQNNSLITRSSQLNGNVKLLFRHDYFFPVDINITTLAENYTVSMKTDPRKTVFNPTQIHSYNFTIAPADSIFMERNALKEQYVPADFSFNDSVIGKVGIRFKGSQYYLLKSCFDSTGRLLNDSTCMKVSLKIKFNKYTDSLRFFSLKRLNLHGMSDDPSKMHEMISYKLFRDMGIYAPKTAYTKVYINGTCWGVFIAVEELDGRFTNSRWPKAGDGNLYKELWASYHTESEILKTLETNDAPEDSANVRHMWNFGKAANYVTASNFKTTISPFMDLNYWLRYITVDRAIHNADGIMTWYFDSASGWSGNHNFYFYEEEGADGKFWLIPWDLPTTLTRTDLIIDDCKVPEWNVKPPNCETPYRVWSKDQAFAPNCDKITGATAEAMWPDFVTIGEQFLASVFTTVRLQATVDTLASILSPAIEKDPTINFNWWKDHVSYLRESMPILHSGYDAYIHGSTISSDSSGRSDIPVQ